MPQHRHCAYPLSLRNRYYKNLIENISQKPAVVINTFRDGKKFWNINGEENMRFDAIVGNPPYQVMDGGNSASALPVYQHFVTLTKGLHPDYISMITPSRWFAGGRGLDEYRDDMLKDKRLAKIIDYADSRECFPTVMISGGINYFLWSKTHKKACGVINVSRGERNEVNRELDEFPVFVRSNQAISIIRKINPADSNSLSLMVFPSNPFGFRTYIRGKRSPFMGSIRLIHSDGIGHVDRAEVKKSTEAIGTYNVILTRAMSGGNKPNIDGSYQIIPSTMKIMKPGEICAETYICIGQFKEEAETEHLMHYLSTRFVRFLMLQAMTSIMISKDVFRFVPMQDFAEDWTDEKLYNLYALTDGERKHIEQLIRPLAIT